MLQLSNDQLSVSILDPVADRERFGTRYCTGGYIFQISDHKLGELLSGPTYPDSFNRFDGQGIPDAFNLSPLLSMQQPDAALIIGIGVCDSKANAVASFCTWNVSQQPDSIRMTTQQSFDDYAFTLERTVSLLNRTVRSESYLKNSGKAFVPMRWFPHPFYPHAGDELCKFNIPVSFPDSAGYELRTNGFIARKNWPWDQRGHYQPLDHEAMTNLVILQRHPLLGLLSATCSYVPSFFPIWGNQNTLSWEPFFERTVAPDQDVRWWIGYDF